ncbi:hypothetical protein GCM10009037_11500 [Halarchaeum grantii]|uniref:UspA domain-containing protein n=1 Tax=Halarchaeum grantii TaxID=1193105 RepID=A0A830F0X2_9EURY|nr:universal stress protein [Halarchaeum grantii]GGL29506.1 hypothetical protein GCM10009037_11500 [Halarchaeum grantii]
MTLFVPYDGSDLARTALVRATEFSTVLDERVVAAAVIPEGNREYARERDWIGPTESFDLDAVVETLHTQVVSLAPQADFEHATVARFAPPGTVAGTLRDLADDADAAIVFIGSENAGDIVSTLGSVGAAVAAEDAYDVHIVRNRAPSKIEAVASASPHRSEKSDFHFPGSAGDE